MTIKQVRDMFHAPGTKFSRAEDRALARAELIYNVTEDILVLMEDLSVSKQELARRLGRSRSYVTQLLGGARNMTLGTLSDISFALGVKPQVSLCDEHARDMLSSELVAATWENASQDVASEHRQIFESRNVIDRSDRLYWV